MCGGQYEYLPRAQLCVSIRTTRNVCYICGAVIVVQGSLLLVQCIWPGERCLLFTDEYIYIKYILFVLGKLFQTIY